MNKSFFEYREVKERFAFLIYKLHEAELLDDYINDTIIKSPFFDCFENNELEAFMSESLESISKKVFRIEHIFKYDVDEIHPYYWAGEMIMTLMANYHIPLKRILLIMPLKEIVGSFYLYHEVSNRKFCNHYLDLERNRPLLKILRNDRSLTLNNISYLANIKLTTVKFLDNSNDILLSTSFRNLINLSELFDISIDVFKKESSYFPYSSILIKSKSTHKVFIDELLKYYGFESSNKYQIIDEYHDDKEIRKMLKEYDYIVDISNPYGIIYSSSRSVKYKFPDITEFILIYKKAIRNLAQITNELVF